ncbi:MAG: vanadium-dependent haloperoxidase [Aggregatilineales bacterium]
MILKTKLRALLPLLALLLVFTVVNSVTVQAQQRSIPTANYDSQFAADWMLFTYELVRGETVNAPAASRVYAYTAIALYESVVFGMPSNFSVAGQMDGLDALPYPASGEVYDWLSVANGSISTVLHSLFPSIAEDAHERIDTMREEQNALRLTETDASIVERSISFGDELGEQLVAWIMTDGYVDIRKNQYALPAGDPSFWVPTTAGQTPLEPFWADLRPFGMGYSSQCNVPIALEFSTDPNSTFYRQAEEVMNTFTNLTEEQREIARFWLDTPGITGAPSGHWLMIQMQFAEQAGLTLDRTAEMYMLTSTAVADAFISAWDMKYQLNLLRPVTYIQTYIRPNWQPYIQSPPFPEYPSGHSVASGAAAEVLTTMFGQVAFTDRTPVINGHEQIERSFTSFEAAASEAAISRMYGGIHYRAAIELGLRQGRCVGERVLNNILLRSIPQGE